MNRASSATGWVRNPVMKSPVYDPTQADSYELGWTFNPITGCLNHVNGLCKGGGFPCYAYKLANGRLKPLYLANKNIAKLPFPQGGEYGVGHLAEALHDPFYPRFWPSRIYQPAHIKKPSGIFTVDMGELFGDWLPLKWQEAIFQTIINCPQHRFYLLTKQPQNLIKWSPFPANCWVGVTVTTWDKLMGARFALKDIEAKVKYISFEPLLSEMRHLDCLELDIDWVIIGACTGRKNEILELCQRNPDLTPMPYGKIWTAQPKIEWVEEIVSACDKAGIPVFLKDNLEPLLGSYPIPKESMWAYKFTSGHFELRQELP